MKIPQNTYELPLTTKTHISNLESKIARSVGVIAKLSYYLPHNTLLTLYYSLVHSHFLYALPVWASTNKTYLTKLQRLQNKALRIISKTRFRDSISQQYYEFHVLKIEDLFTFEIAKIMHQFTHRKTPRTVNSYFSYTMNASSHLTRQAYNNNIFLPRFRNLRCQRSLKYIGPKIWNNWIQVILFMLLSLLLFKLFIAVCLQILKMLTSVSLYFYICVTDALCNYSVKIGF